MDRAIALAAKCVDEPGRRGPAPKVAVVIAKGDHVLAEAYRGEDPKRPGAHAEYLALEKIADDVDLSTAEAFTTLEPCSRRGPGKTPCADRLIARGISTVYIGAYDNDPAIYRQGWKKLRDAGLQLRDFPAELRNRIAKLNDPFVSSFERGLGDEGDMRFGWANGRSCRIKTSKGIFEFSWSTCSASQVYVYARSPAEIADAKFVEQMGEIDDPDVFAFSPHGVSPPPRVGSILVFRIPNPAHLFVQVLRIDPDNEEVVFRWKLAEGRTEPN